MVAGVVTAHLVLPGGLEGRQRIVRISLDRIRHIAERRPGRASWPVAYLGYRPDDSTRVEFVRNVRPRRYNLLVAVKLLDEFNESWVSTVHPMAQLALTRRLRACTMQAASRGP